MKNKISEKIFVYLFYFTGWIVWFFKQFFRLPKFLIYYFGINSRNILKVKVKVITDKNGKYGMNIKDVNKIMNNASKIFDKMNIQLETISTEEIQNEKVLYSTTCKLKGIFSYFFVWFSKYASENKNIITIYFLININNKSGCAYPGTNWVMIDKEAKGCTVVQEIGHLCDIWIHSDTYGNIMHNPCGKEDITKIQRSLIKSSRFVKIKV